MKLQEMTIMQIRKIQERLSFELNNTFRENGNLWLEEARKVRDEFQLTDKEVLDIANNRLSKYFII